MNNPDILQDIDFIKIISFSDQRGPDVEAGFGDAHYL